MLEQILRNLKRGTLSREIKDVAAIEEENAGKHSGQVTASACPLRRQVTGLAEPSV